MSSDTWTTRDLPVLRAIVDHYEETGDDQIQPWDLQQRTGFAEATVQKALRALNREPYFENAFMVDDGDIWELGPPTAAALRIAGQWPSPELMLQRLIAALEETAGDEDLPEEERGKLKRTAAFLRTSAWQIALNALGGAGGSMIAGG